MTASQANLSDKESGDVKIFIGRFATLRFPVYRQ
jgi:hypothetical protein